MQLEYLKDFVAAGGALAAAAMAGRVVFGRALRLNLTRRPMTVATALFVLLVVANWIYVIRYVHGLPPGPGCGGRPGPPAAEKNVSPPWPLEARPGRR